MLGADEGDAVVPVAEVVNLETIARPDPGTGRVSSERMIAFSGERVEVLDAGRIEAAPSPCLGS